MCKYIFIRGNNKGKQCSVKPRNSDSDYCGKHSSIILEKQKVANNPRAYVKNEKKRRQFFRDGDYVEITWTEISDCCPTRFESYCNFYISNPAITWDIVQSHPEVDWQYCYLSKNPNITWDIVKKNPDKPWDYDILSMNPNITLDIILSNTEKPWSLKHFCISNWNMTINLFKQHIDVFKRAPLPFNSYVQFLRLNETIPLDEIKENKEFFECAKEANKAEPSLNSNLYKLRVFYHPYFQSSIYKKQANKKMMDLIREELIAKACHPSRMFNWNEDVCIQFPEQYEQECNRYRQMK